jgi:hypothetical protein
MKANVDYVVSYGSNKAIGKGSITITGKGKYYGSKKVSFNIIPRKVSLKSVKIKNGSAVLKWKSAAAAQKITGYAIEYRMKNGTWKTKLVKRNARGVTIGKLKKGKTYQFRIRAYKTVGGVKYSSKRSAVKSASVKGR